VTLPHGTDRLESDRLVRRRVTPEETAKWLRATLARSSRSAISRSCARKMERSSGADGPAFEAIRMATLESKGQGRPTDGPSRHGGE
jgi:hypothetical protein